MNRSCKFCKFRYEQESLIGTVQMCDMWDKEVSKNDYCTYFSETRELLEEAFKEYL